MNFFRTFKKNNEKENYEEFCKVYLESIRKDNDSVKKTALFNSKYFNRKNFRIVVLEQTGNNGSIQYDSHPSNNTIKEISSPSNHGNSFFNVNINKELYDTIFGQSGGLNDSPFKNKIHFLTQENQIIFTLIYPSYSQILKRIRSQSHSPSLSRSSSLGDYASLNNAVLNDLSAQAASQSQRRVSICVAWSCPLDDPNHMRLFFRFIVYYLQFLSILAEKIAYVHQENQSFCTESMNRVRHWFVESLRAFFIGPKLALPVWNTSILLKNHKWFKEAQLLPGMMRVFLNRVMLHLLNKYHTKEKDFILAKLLTVVLTYHQGWIHSINGPVFKRHLRQFTCQPGICQQHDSKHNPLCSQLGSALLGWGGVSIARTIVLGSNQHMVSLILYFLSYWIRTCPIVIRQEILPDCSTNSFNLNLYTCANNGDKCKTTTRRKSASCNDSVDNGLIAPSVCSQEDLRRNKLPSTGTERGSIGSGIHHQHLINGGGPGSTRSSISQGSSPVKELSETYHLTKNMMISHEQMLDVNRMAEEYVKQFTPDQKSGSGNVLNNIYVREIPMEYGGKTKAEEDILYRSVGHICIGGVQDTLVTGMVLQGVLSHQGNNSGSYNGGVMVGANYGACTNQPNGLNSLNNLCGHVNHECQTNSNDILPAGVTATSNCPSGYYNGVLDELLLAEELRFWLRHIFWLYGGAPAKRGGAGGGSGVGGTIPDMSIDSDMVLMAAVTAVTNSNNSVVGCGQSSGTGSSNSNTLHTTTDSGYFQPPLCERPQSATAIILNLDKCTVSLFTVTSDSRVDPIIHELESPSHLVMNMLDQLQSLLSTRSQHSQESSTSSHHSSSLSSSPSSQSINNMDDIYIQFIESQLKNFHRMSLCLAHTLRDLKLRDTDLAFDNCSFRNNLARLIGCHTDDLPLLYSTALSHSPDIYLQDSSLFY